jgi:histidine phosphotransfer protein HptB
MAEELLDLNTFNELTDTVGADFVIELVDTFLEEAPPILAEMRAALGAGDADTFRRAAHSLKTNANTFGAKVLGERARELEQGGLLSAGDGVDALDALYAESAAALKALCNG